MTPPIAWWTACLHGGAHVVDLTWPGEPDDVLWFGFDTSHAGDAKPSDVFPWSPRDVYRTQVWVQLELERLAGEAARACCP